MAGTIHDWDTLLRRYKLTKQRVERPGHRPDRWTVVGPDGQTIISCDYLGNNERAAIEAIVADWPQPDGASDDDVADMVDHMLGTRIGRDGHPTSGNRHATIVSPGQVAEAMGADRAAVKRTLDRLTRFGRMHSFTGRLGYGYHAFPGGNSRETRLYRNPALQAAIDEWEAVPPDVLAQRALQQIKEEYDGNRTNGRYSDNPGMWPVDTDRMAFVGREVKAAAQAGLITEARVRRLGGSRWVPADRFDAWQAAVDESEERERRRKAHADEVADAVRAWADSRDLPTGRGDKIPVPVHVLEAMLAALPQEAAV